MGKYEWLTEFPVANRGYHTGDHILPENSMAAFQNAVKANFAIELDVQITRDKQVVVFPDEDLQRMCGTDLKVGNTGFEVLSKHKLLNSEHRIQLLADVLKMVNDKVPVVIDLKSAGVPGKLERAVLKAIDGYGGRVAVQSFDPFTLRWFSRHAPEITRGQLMDKVSGKTNGFFAGLLLKSFAFLLFSKPHFIACEHTLIPYRRIEKLRDVGFIVLGWVIQTKADAERLKPFTDNIIFEGFEP